MRQIGFGVESTYGTPATATRFFEFMSWGVKPVHAFKDITTLRNYSPLGAVYGGYVCEGPAQIAANYNGIGLLLKHLLGSVTTAGTADPYTHIFPATTGIPAADRIGLGLTMQAALEDTLVWTYAGGKIENFKLSLKLDDVATIDLALVAKSVATGTAHASATYGTFEPLIPTDCYLEIDSVEQPCQSIDIEIKNPLDRPRIMRTQGLGREPRRNGPLEVTITANALLEAFTGWHAALDGSTPVVATVNAVKSVGRSLTFAASNCLIWGDDPTAEGWNRLIPTITLKGYFNATADENCLVELINGDAAP